MRQNHLISAENNIDDNDRFCAGWELLVRKTIPKETHIPITFTGSFTFFLLYYRSDGSDFWLH